MPPSFLQIVHHTVESIADPHRWKVEAGEEWIHIAQTREVPVQGWKLHISACGISAPEVLRRAVPVLLGESASFKVAASEGFLNDLNEGHGGLSQVGKFLTVYPSDDAQAVRLAVELDTALEGLRGPRVPSDRPLRRGSLVHYRYGGFTDLFLQTRFGQILPALRDPADQLVPDERRSRFAPPEWAKDPFVEAGVAADLPASNRIVGGRYLVVATLHESVRGKIISAIDLVSPRTCLLKHAQRGSMIGPNGRDAWDRLHHERGILARLSDDERFPQPFDLIEQGEDLYLAMTHFEGVTLEQHVHELSTSGRFTPMQQIFAWAGELVRALGTLHKRGIIYRDLKSPNILVSEDGHLRIVDFELAYEVGGTTSDGRGTRGYLSPQQEQEHMPSVTDDIYGLGAVLYFVATGAEPSLAPRPFDLLDRPLRLLNPEVRDGLERIVACCLNPEAGSRFPSMAAVEAALDAALEERTEGAATIPAKSAPLALSPSPEFDNDGRKYQKLAESLGDTLCRFAKRSSDGESILWISTHENRAGIAARDLSLGSAGPILALADLVHMLKKDAHREVLVKAARSLAEAPRPAVDLLPGLYVGEAGIGTALLRAGVVLGDSDLVSKALDRGQLVASLPYGSPDMFNGTAGRLRFHIWLWDVTSDDRQLHYAKQAGLELVKAAERSEEAGAWWTIPPGYGGLSGSAYLGYAHGAAGIADALLDLFEVSGDERFLASACDAGKWIAQHAFQTLPDGSGLDWPDTIGGTSIGPFWCHGAAGIGQFFLHTASLGVWPEAEGVTLRAAQASARGARWSGPTQCHGLAGNIEFLLDMHQTTRNPSFLAEALELGRLLIAFGRQADGYWVWPSESPTTVTPDYTVGYAGVAACLLRLSSPSLLPRQLSRRGFAQVCSGDSHLKPLIGDLR
jgi:serine/threonine protein kinase